MKSFVAVLASLAICATAVNLESEKCLNCSADGVDNRPRVIIDPAMLGGATWASTVLSPSASDIHYATQAVGASEYD